MRKSEVSGEIKKLMRAELDIENVQYGSVRYAYEMRYEKGKAVMFSVEDPIRKTELM